MDFLRMNFLFTLIKSQWRRKKGGGGGKFQSLEVRAYRTLKGKILLFTGKNVNLKFRYLPLYHLDMIMHTN